VRYIVRRVKDTPSGYTRWAVFDTKEDKVVSQVYFYQWAAKQDAKRRNEEEQCD